MYMYVKRWTYCFRFAHSAEATHALACLRRKGCFCFRQRFWMGNDDDDELCQLCDISLIEIIYCFWQTQWPLLLPPLLLPPLLPLILRHLGLTILRCVGMTIFRRLGSSSLHHVATSCEYSHQVAAFCNMFQHFQHVATVCNISQHFVAFCNILQHCVSFCSILHHFGQRFATLCSILYNFATFCNILQLFCKLAEVQEAKVLYFLAWLGSGWDLGGESVVFL